MMTSTSHYVLLGWWSRRGWDERVMWHD